MLMLLDATAADIFSLQRLYAGYYSHANDHYQDFRYAMIRAVKIHNKRHADVAD